MTLVLLLMLQGRTSGGHGLLEATPRIYQVTPDIPDRRRATKQKQVRPKPADSLKESQLAARSGPSPPRRTSPTAESKQQASMRQRDETCRQVAVSIAARAKRNSMFEQPDSCWRRLRNSVPQVCCLRARRSRQAQPGLSDAAGAGCARCAASGRRCAYREDGRRPAPAARPKGAGMTRRCRSGWLASVLVLAGLLSPGVGFGAAPTFERIEVDDTFVDEQLSEACGVTATVTLQGQITLRTFADEGTGLVTLNTLNLAATITADGRTFRLRDVGGDLVRIEPDGTALLYITGQVPFAFAGVLIIDPQTEEVILEPRDRSEEQVAKACRFLTGG